MIGAEERVELITYLLEISVTDILTLIGSLEDLGLIW